MTGAERQQTAGHTAGMWTPLTSFVGRADDAAELTRLLAGHRLVTVTGPGGMGKTRLATEVARHAGGRFPDGVWFTDLAAVSDAADVPAKVTSALSVRQDPDRPALEVLTEVLARRRMLLILDNCEHVLSAVAELCDVLLKNADDVHVLATSREQIGIAGEVRYRLGPLELPVSDEPGAITRSAAASLFIERARQADPRFTIGPEHAPLVARVVARLDGMPLAIELAAARLNALGLAGLADRIDSALRLLTGNDVLSAARHRSLAAVADWSYQLLDGPGRRVFRRLAVFPGPFTLEAAETVAGPDAGPVVLRLVDSSLLAPPRLGDDRRTRYSMLQILRAYALTRLREAGEEQEAEAALASFAQSVAEQASAGSQRGESELAALRWLDAEDASLSRALSWALEHDPEGALRLATALVPWLRLRGRLAEARTKLAAATARAPAANENWARAQLWLGHLALDSNDQADSMAHFTAAIDAYANWAPSPVLVQALTPGRVIVRRNRRDFGGAVDDARRGLALAREIGDAASELLALATLSLAVYYAGDAAEALDHTRQARELLSSDVPGWVTRWCHYALALVLTQLGELDASRGVCAAGLSLARQAEDLPFVGALLGAMGDLELVAGNPANAATLLREAVDIAARTGNRLNLTNLVEQCGYSCAEAGHWANARTLWAAVAADRKRRGWVDSPVNEGLHANYMQRAEQALAPGQLREADERGARMPVSAAAEFAIMATTAAGQESLEPAPPKLLTPRERELVTLVAQGHTNAEIAARLYISVRTVSSHLDRIRDKTGCRRRAELTRLALEDHLI